MATKITNPLHIYIDLKSQNNILEKKTDGVYQLKNRTGSFLVSIKEYQDELAILQENYKKNPDKLKSEKALLVKKFEKVRWIYQLSPLGVPKNAKYTEGSHGAVERSVTLEELEVGGGFVYIQPYLLTDNYVPENNLATGAIYFSYGQPEILDAKWFEDERATLPINSDTKVAFGSTVFLRISTKDLYGQIINIEFKDDDSLLGGNEEDKYDDDLGIYPFSNQRASYELYDDLPKIINRDTQIKRQIKTLHLPTKPENAIVGELNLEDKNKEDGKVTKINAYQGVIFSVYIDKFWSKEANDFSERNEIEIFPTIPERYVKNGKILNFSILKNATLKVSKDGVVINPNNAQYNLPVLQGEVESDFSNFLPCKYETIDLFYNKKVPIFNSKTNFDNSYHPIELVTKQKDNNVSIFLGALETAECENHDSEKNHSKIKFAVSSTVINPEINEASLSFNATPPSHQELLFNDVRDLGPKKYTVVASTCAYTKDLKIYAYPDIEFIINAAINVEDDKTLEKTYLYVKQTKKYNQRKYNGNKKTKAVKKVHNKRNKEKYQNNVDNEVTGNSLLKDYNIELSAEYSIDGKQQIAFETGTVASIKDILNGILNIYSTIDSYLFGTKMEDAEKEQPEEYKKIEHTRKKKAKVLKGVVKDLPLRLQVTPPKFSGGMTWSFKESVQEPGKVGSEYKFVFKADPLISTEGKLDLLFAAQFIPYVNVVVKSLDSAVAFINSGGEIMQYFGVGNVEADYYFNFVVKAGLNIDIPISTYHTIDGFTDGSIEIYSPIEVGLEAGGSIRVEVFDLYGEAMIHASAKAKFKLIYKGAKQSDNLTFEFEGIEATVKAKIIGSQDQNDSHKDDGNTPSDVPTKEKTVKIFDGFNVEIPFFDYNSQ